MRIREYKKEDAEQILGWITNERAFRLWTADRYGTYPIVPDDINKNYDQSMETGNFYPLTLVDENEKTIGHLILRNPGDDKTELRLGFIIVDNTIRGKGYGKLLINSAIQYAKEKLNANKFNLGVFANNDAAYNCYKKCGFVEVDIEKDAYTFENEKWDCIEMILS